MGKGKKYIIELLDDCQSEFKGIMVFGLTQEKQISVELIPEESLRLYTEPDLEQVRKEAYEQGYKKCLSEHDFDSPCVSCDEYKRGLNDAWEAARKIVSIPTAELHTMFDKAVYYDTVFRDCTASEAIEKIRQYEQEKEEQIQVGDEVDWMGDKYVVTYVRCEAKKADLISCKFGSACENVAFSALGKTGRTFPEIVEVLRKMKEAE